MLVEIFLKILNLSLGAIPLMLVLLLLRAALKKRLPRKVFYIAWALVFIRLVVPFSPASEASIFNFLPHGSVIEREAGTAVVFVENNGETVNFPVLSREDENPLVDLPSESSAAGESPRPAVVKSPVDRNLIFGAVWGFGAVALLLFGIGGYFAVLSKLKFESVPYVNNVLLSEMFKTPVVCGLIKPKIVLPLTLDTGDEAKLASVLSHECTHIRRGDNFWRLLAAFTLYIHWFNPLVWVCYCAFIRDMEVSCDEAVLAAAKYDIRSEYAESLISLANGGTSPLYGGALAFGESGIKERVERIMNFKKAKLLIIIICFAAIAALAAIFLTNPAIPPEEPKEGLYRVVTVNAQRVDYSEEFGLDINATFINDGENTLWIAPDTSLWYFDEFGTKEWVELDVGFQNSGTVMVGPGEEVVFCDGISPSSFKSEPPTATCRIRKEVFFDQELRESAGYADCVFDLVVIEIAVGAEETNPQPGSDEPPASENTQSNGSGESQSVPADTAEKYLIPSNASVIANLFCNSDKTYVTSKNQSELREILKYENFIDFGSSGALADDLGERFDEVDTAEFARLDDGKKYTLRIYENGFVLEGSAVDEEDKGKAFIVDDANWNNFRKTILAEYINTENYAPYWLGLINEKNVNAISVGRIISQQKYSPEDDCFSQLVSRLRKIAVFAPPERFDGNELAFPSASEEYVHFSISFNTGTLYSVIIAGDKISMVSSDMSYGLTYTLIDPSGSYDEFRDYLDEGGSDNPLTGKPVIYLYPEKTTDVSVKLDFDGKLTYTYPAYGGGWNVTAEPDGTLINKADGSTHYYLFWEGVANFDWSHESGFVVKGSETEAFLLKTLAEMGLTPREYNDFITYWVPKMQNNKYNLISFSGEEYAEGAKLTVSPAPESVLRVHMVWMALDEPIEIPAQSFEPFERTGFTLVEWGGTEVFK